jgi:hypothetical protein
MTVLQRTRYSIRKFSVIFNLFVSFLTHVTPDCAADVRFFSELANVFVVCGKLSPKLTLWRLKLNLFMQKIQSEPHRKHSVLPLEAAITGKWCTFNNRTKAQILRWTKYSDFRRLRKTFEISDRRLRVCLSVRPFGTATHTHKTFVNFNSEILLKSANTLRFWFTSDTNIGHKWRTLHSKSYLRVVRTLATIVLCNWDRLCSLWDTNCDRRKIWSSIVIDSTVRASKFECYRLWTSLLIAPQWRSNINLWPR